MASQDDENESERHMRQVLEHEGFRVVRVPSRSTKTADYRVSDELHKYLIEVKSKVDDPEMMAIFEQDFLEKGEATRREPGGYTSGMTKIIREAAKQLHSTPTDPGEFKLIWFAARGDSPELQMDQFRATLFGEVCVVTARAGQSLRTMPCYYFTFSEFYTHRHIDGAIASSETHGGLYMNTFSSKAGALRKTKLFRMFDSFGAVCDPPALEARDDALVFDLDTDRRDKAAVYSALCEKYRFAPDQLLPIEGQVVTARIGFTAPIKLGSAALGPGR
jgi:hypothetical protein